MNKLEFEEIFNRTIYSVFLKKKKTIYSVIVFFFLRNNIYIYIYIFFLGEIFNLCHLLLIITFYHQAKILISFCCKWRLNPKSLIQPSETLLANSLESTEKQYIP